MFPAGLKTIADNNGKQWIIEYGGEITRGDYDEGGIYIPPPLVIYRSPYR